MRLRPAGAIELPLARRRRLRAERPTVALGAVTLGLSAAALGGEVARVWRRGAAPLPSQTSDVLGAAEVAARETVEVARVGLRHAGATETALLNLLGSFAATFAVVRASTLTIRRRGRFGPFRDLHVGSSHIHHFVPGIVMALVAGGAGILSRDERVDPWLAVPFGVGAALTLDESALLLKLDDVYWTEEGIVSVQITLSAVAMLSTAMLALRVLRRGEARGARRLSRSVPSGRDGGRGPGLRPDDLLAARGRRRRAPPARRRTPRRRRGSRARRRAARPPSGTP